MCDQVGSRVQRLHVRSSQSCASLQLTLMPHDSERPPHLIVATKDATSTIFIKMDIPYGLNHNN